MTAPAHPAKFPKQILECVWGLVDDEARSLGRRPIVLDPFAGVGTIHRHPWHYEDTDESPFTIASELELEWVAQGSDAGPCIVADATSLPIRPGSVDIIVTSPVYGNRMSDSHDAQERCKPCGGTGLSPIGDDGCSKCDGTGRRNHVRHTYTHNLGRKLHANNSGRMKFPGARYEQLHEDAWHEAGVALRPGGLAIVNAKNFHATVKFGDARVSALRHVVEWHLNTWMRMGYTVHSITRIGARGMRHGSNGEVRVDAEHVIAVRKPGLLR